MGPRALTLYNLRHLNFKMRVIINISQANMEIQRENTCEEYHNLQISDSYKVSVKNAFDSDLLKSSFDQ